MTDTTTAPADGANAPEKNTDIPVQTSAPEALVVATDETEQRADQTETSTEVEANAQPEGEGRKAPPKLPEWAQKQMAQQAFEAREAKRRADAAEAELARLKAPPPAQTTQADANAAQQNAPAGGYKSQAEFDAAVQAEANNRAAAARAREEADNFRRNLDTAWSKGLEAYGADDFGAVAANLSQVGFVPLQDPATGAVTNTEMMQLVLEADDPAKVLYELGSDPAKALALMQMSPNKRAMEIAKMSVAAPAKVAPAPLSNAPRPVVPVEGSAKPNGEPADNDDDATWFAKRNAQIQRRYQGAA